MTNPNRRLGLRGSLTRGALLVLSLTAVGLSTQGCSEDDKKVFVPTGGGAAGSGFTITTTTLPDATVGQSYSQTLASSGGSGAVAFSVWSGSLPAGLTLAGSGTISGTPTATGSTTFTVSATDSASPAQEDLQTLTLTVGTGGGGGGGGPGSISTIAGTGAASFGGDGGAATAAPVNQATGVAVDAAGNVFVADRDNHRIRKIDASTGVISTVAGTGIAGFGGDGGPATSAQLNGPRDVAFDGAGNLYVADEFNGRIRKISISGTISTIAGNGTFGFSGDGGQAIAAQLSAPNGVAVDTASAANVYIADWANDRVRRVDGQTGVITTVAGSSSTGFGGDGGPATSALLDKPEGVAVDSLGRLYIADGNNHRLRRVSSGVISTIAGTGAAGFSGDGGPATSAQLAQPAAVFVDASGSVWIADNNNNRIRKIDTAGNILTVAGSGATGWGTGGYGGDGGPATSALLNQPIGIHVTSGGVLYVADQANNRIRKVLP